MILVSKTYWGGWPWVFRRPPEDAELESRWLRTEDFRQLHALWWTPRGRKPKTAVVVMHPRVDFTHHYCVPRLVDAGYGVLAANSRSPNDDTALVHEDLLLDVAASIRWLRERRGIERVVLFGNSGGGSLFSFYQAQAARDPKQRLAQTPAGAPTKLRGATMIPADALALVAAHRGQGKILLGAIDPAVVDEDDPLQTDGELDMYSADNGFADPPAWSEYDDSFVTRYREAQAARVRRIDAWARGVVEAQREAPEGSPESIHDPVRVVYRTMANLAYVAQNVDPSPRDYGSLLSERPDLMRFSRIGFARTVTAAGWLSTWSGLTSNACLDETLPDVRVPVLVAHAGRDREIFPADVAKIHASVRADDATFLDFPNARHYFEPNFGEKDAPDVEALMDAVVPWIQERVGG